jgi:hypothetical protein
MINMIRCAGLAIAATALLGGIPRVQAQAQSQNPVYVPGQPAPIPPPPPPLPPPPPPQVNPPQPNTPRKIDSFGDRATRCQHYGGAIGLPPGQIDAYVRGCANN